MLKIPRLDAIVYRTGGRNPCYVSEHGCSQARAEDFYHSLSRLRSQVREDLSSGLCPAEDHRLLRPFVTCVDALLPLRSGAIRQAFLGCAYEAINGHGRKNFVSFCPTNYLSNDGEKLMDSLDALGEIIEARYVDECMTDLMRELPKTPLVTTFDPDARCEIECPTREVGAVIVRKNDTFEASSPGIAVTARADEPYKALRGLESALAGEPAAVDGTALCSDQIFGAVDVQLSLPGSFLIKRFLVAIAPHDNGSRYYGAHAPQAEVTTKALTIEGALQGIKDAIALKLINVSAEGVDLACRSRPIMTTACIGRAPS
jgi:hypothetical protein